MASACTCSHGASRETTARAILGGLVFGGSPYIAAHLNVHFNLTMAWTIPLYAIAISEAIRGSRSAAVFAGLVLGVTAYIDYYYVVYELALTLSIAALAAREWSIALRGPSPGSRRLAQVVALVILVDVAVVAAIAATGGFNAQIGPIRIFARGIFNPLQRGEGVRNVYGMLGIDAIESTGWLGIAPVVLAAWALRQHLGAAFRSKSAARHLRLTRVRRSCGSGPSSVWCSSCGRWART